MKLIRIALAVASFTLPAVALETATDAAKTADLSFLKLVDSAQYGQSWRVTAAIFQTQVTQAQWEQAMTTARTPLGSLTERKPQDATYTTTLPGAPDGNYVVAHFQTSFEKKQSAIETVVTSREKDGTWHVSGYFIK